MSPAGRGHLLLRPQFRVRRTPVGQYRPIESNDLRKKARLLLKSHKIDPIQAKKSLRELYFPVVRWFNYALAQDLLQKRKSVGGLFRHHPYLWGRT
jgi:hypothetical protein